VERAMYFDADGKPITVSLKDYTRAQIHKEYASLNDFLTVWNKAEQKTAIIKELEERNVLLGDWEKAVNKELDPFDLICHTAFDMSPLTRRERAENVRKRNYFVKYGDIARQVLSALLDKYADEGIENVESRDILKVNPFTSIGTPMEIIKAFGSAEKYDEAIRELEQELYKSAA
jgi:type I restriction enzyme, R subunit